MNRAAIADVQGRSFVSACTRHVAFVSMSHSTTIATCTCCAHTSSFAGQGSHPHKLHGRHTVAAPTAAALARARLVDRMLWHIWNFEVVMYTHPNLQMHQVKQLPVAALAVQPLLLHSSPSPSQPAYVRSQPHAQSKVGSCQKP